MKNSQDVAKRLLFLSCSKAKSQEKELLPAIARYDGSLFRVLKKFLRSETGLAKNLSILILSAEYGLISADELIPFYDRAMDSARALELKQSLTPKLKNYLTNNNFQQIFICLGKKYRAVFGNLAFLDSERVTFAEGATGVQQQQLKKWLYGLENFESFALTKKNKIKSNGSKRNFAVLKGRKIFLTKNEIYKRGRFAIENEGKGFENFRAWYVLINQKKVGVKWLAAEVTDLPVSAFTSREARRFLQNLGIKVESL